MFEHNIIIIFMIVVRSHSRKFASNFFGADA